MKLIAYLVRRSRARKEQYLALMKAIIRSEHQLARPVSAGEIREHGDLGPELRNKVGLFYDSLSRLERDGYLVVVNAPRVSRRIRRSGPQRYSINDAGKARLEQ